MYEVYEKLLAQHGVTTADVCRATGISQATMAMWKKRRGKITAENASKIAGFFGVSVPYLLGEDEQETDDGGYYVYGETAQIAQELLMKPGLRVLFDAARDADPDDLLLVAQMISRMKGTNRDS